MPESNYNYSMNFNLTPDYFGANQQARSNAQLWMNGINKAVNQIAAEYQIPPEDLDAIVTVASMAPITESAYGTAEWWKRKNQQKDIIRNIGKSVVDPQHSSPETVEAVGDGAVNLGRAIKRGLKTRSWQKFKQTLNEGESTGFANLKHRKTPTQYQLFDAHSVEQDAIDTLYHIVQLYNQTKKSNLYYKEKDKNNNPIPMNLATRLSYLYTQGRINNNNGQTNFTTSDDYTMSKYGIPTDVGVAYQFLALRNGLSRNGQLIKKPHMRITKKSGKVYRFPNLYENGGTLYFHNGRRT